jgi:hypothetical protein
MTHLSVAARILEPGGHMCVCVTHPLSNAGNFINSESGSAFHISETYFGRRNFEGTFERDGLTMTFRGWSMALEDYTRTFEGAGLLLEALREPQPSDTTARFAAWHRMPMFLTMRLVKP